MKTVGISAVGGAGRAIADIILSGYSKVDLYDLDVSRFAGLHNNRRFLMDRVREVPGNIHAEFDNFQIYISTFCLCRNALRSSISIS